MMKSANTLSHAFLLQLVKCAAVAVQWFIGSCFNAQRSQFCRQFLSVIRSAVFFICVFASSLNYGADQVPINNSAGQQSQITATLDGTPVQNIVSPNASGVSHNVFDTFNVSNQGLVINNSKVDTVSNIGGALLGNANLAGGEASLIINEVASGNRTSLNGAQELVGGQAGYILANPNGITCNGCGFINFPRVSITTGSPIMSGGSLTGLDVDGGDILIEGAGLNAENIEHFDIISRAITLTGEIHTGNLSLVTGRNTVNYADNTATAKADDGSTKPTFALDSSALGGMYANRITLVGTEQGVGVRALGDMAASVDDISLDANGQISFNGNDVSAQGSIQLSSDATVSLDNSTVYAAENNSIEADTISMNGGRTGAGNNLTFAANSYTDTASGISDASNNLRDAGNNLTINVTGNVSSSSNLQAVNDLSITANDLQLQNNQVVAATNQTGDLSVTASGTLSLTNAGLNSDNTATISASNITVDANSHKDSNKGVQTGGLTTVTASSDLQLAGSISTDGNLTISAPQLNLTGDGELSSTGNLNVANGASPSSSVTTAANTLIQGDVLDIKTDALTVTGTLYGDSSALLTSDDVTINSGGLVATNGSLSLSQTAAGGSLDNAGGFEVNALVLTMDSLINSGSIFSSTTANFTSNTFNNSGDLIVDGDTVFNTWADRVQTFTNTGTIDVGKLDLYADSVANDGTLYSGSSIDLYSSSLTNRATLASSGYMSLRVTDLTNTPTLGVAADIMAGGDLYIADNHVLTNQSANGITPSLISTGGRMTIWSTSGVAASQGVYNDGGLFFGANGLDVYVSRELKNTNQGVIFAASGTMNLGAQSSATLTSASQDVTVNNIDSRIENNNGDISIVASYFYNTTAETLDTLTTTVQYRITQNGVQIWDAGSSTYVDATSCGSSSTYSESFMIGDYCRSFPKKTFYETVWLGEHTIQNNTPIIKFYWTYNGVDYGIDGSNCGTNYDPNFKLGDSCVRTVTVTEQLLPSATEVTQRSALVASNDINLWIEKEAENYVSLVSAGNNFTVDGEASATFTNRSINLTKTETSSYYVDRDGGVYPFGEVECGSTVYVWNLTGKSCFWVGNEVHYKSWTYSGSVSDDSLAYGIPSTVQAGNNISINVVNNNEEGGTDNYVSAPVSSGAISDPALTGSITSLSPATVSGITALSTSPFFVLSTDPDSPFLYVTDPRFADLNNLYGSDFFLDALGLDPAENLRLGDPYYELQLLRQQILAEAGQLYVTQGMANETDQFAYLMENGLSVSEDLQLTFGVALTADQINNLQKDIVWMVETEVNGQTVLVPQLYLSNTTRADLAEGAKFVASNIDIQTEGEVTNSGAYVANNITVDADTFTNRLGTVTAGNELNLNTKGDLINESGTLAGENVTVASDAGSVINRTLTEEGVVLGAFGQGTNTEVGDIATISANTDLDISAGGSIISEGGDLSALNNVTLDAGDEITMTVIETNSYEEVHEQGFNGQITSDTQTSIKTRSSIGTELITGGNLSLSSGGDTTIEGSDVIVTGDLNIDKVGGDLNVTTYEDEVVINSKNRTSTFSAGGEVETDKEKGDHDLTSTAKASLSYTVETSTTDITSKTHNRSEIIVGGNINSTDAEGNATVDGDLNITGSDIVAAGNIDLNAKGNINILAAEDETVVNQSSESNGVDLSASISMNGPELGIGVEHNESNSTLTQTTAQVSTITGGGALDVNAGGDFTEQGTQVATTGDINIEADSVNSLAAKNTYSESGDSLTVSGGLTVSAETGLGDMVGAFIDDKGEATFDMADAAKAAGAIDVPDAGSVSAELSVSTTKTTYSSSGNTVTTSGFGSAGDVNITARQGDATFEGTSIEADGSIGVTAEQGDVKVLTAQSKEESRSDTTEVDVSVSVSGDGSGAISGSGGDSHEDAKSTTNTVASFQAGEGIDLKAKNDVQMVGTQLEAGADVNVTAEEGSIEYLAAYDTTESNSSTNNTNATVGGGMGGEVTLGGGHSEEASHESTSTGQAGSISATNINFNAKKDITLEGTQLDADDSVSIASTEGALDYKAITDTTLRTKTGMSAEGEISGGKTGGSLSGGGSGTDEYEQTTTQTGGSINAGNITITTATGVRLQGTEMAADTGSIDAGSGKLVVESAVSSTTKRINNTAVDASLSADKSEQSGSASLKIQGEYEDTATVTNQNASLNIGSLTLKADEGIELAGKDIEGIETIATGTNTIEGPGVVAIEQREDVNRSQKSSIDVSVGVVLPSKNIRDKTIGKVKDKVTNTSTYNKLNNKLETAGNKISSATEKLNTKVKNTYADASTAVKNVGADASTRDSNNAANDRKKLDNKLALADTLKREKDKSTERKRVNTETYADSKANKQLAKLDKAQTKQDQKADYEQQKADRAAEKERDNTLAEIKKDTTKTAAERKQAIQTAEDQLASKKQANADAAATRKTNNADMVAKRNAIIDKQVLRKEQANDKAKSSQEQHADDITSRKQILADKTSGAEAERIKTQAETQQSQRKEQLEQQSVAQQATLTASKERAKADVAIKKEQQTAELQADAKAQKALAQQQAEKAKKDAEIDADSSKTAEQKQQAKAENAKALADKQAEVKQRLADEKQIAANRAEKKQQVELAKAQEKIANDKADFEKQKSIGLSETNRVAKVDEAKALRDQTIAQADSDFTAEESRINQEHQSELDRIGNKQSQDRQAVELARQTANDAAEAEFNRKKTEIENDSSLSNDKKAELLRKNQDDFDEAKVKNDAKATDQRTEIARKADLERTAADQAKITELATATKAHDDAKTDARAEFTATEAQANSEHARNSEVAADKAEQQTLSLVAKREQDDALLQAFENKQAADQVVRGDTQLSADQKAQKLRDNERQYAAAEEAARVKRADDEKQSATDLDSRSKARDKAAIDSDTTLTDAQKQARKQLVDADYVDRTRYRDLEHQAKVAEYKAETKQRKAIADAGDARDQAVQQARTNKTQDEASAATARDTRLAQYDADKQADYTAIDNDPNLSADRKAELKKTIDDEYSRNVAASNETYQQDLAKAEKKAAKAEADANQQLENEIALADAKHAQEVADAASSLENLRIRKRETAAMHKAIEQYASQRDKALGAAAEQRDSKIAEATETRKAAETAAQSTYDTKVAEVEQARRDADARAQTAFEEKKADIEADTSLSATEKQQQLDLASTELASKQRENQTKENQDKASASTALASAKDTAKTDFEAQESIAKNAFNAEKQKHDADFARDKAYAEATAATQKKLAKRTRDAERTLASKAFKHAEQTIKIDSDASLSPQDKADKHFDNDKALADARETTKIEQANKSVEERNNQDQLDRDYEKSLVDASDLSDSEKQDQKTAIDNKYQTRKDARQQELEVLVGRPATSGQQAKPGSIKREADHARELAQKDKDLRTANAAAEATLSSAKTSAVNDKTRLDRDAESTRDSELTAIDANQNLSQDEKTAERKKVTDKYDQQLLANERQYEQAIADANNDAVKARHEAAATRKKEAAIADAKLVKERALAELENRTGLTDEAKNKRREAIEKAYTDKETNLTERHTVWQRDIAVRHEAAKALSDKTFKEQAIDADTTLNAEQRKTKKAAIQAEYDTLAKTITDKKGQIEKDYTKLQTKEEKAAAALLKQQAELAAKNNGKIANPYAKWPRIKHHLASAQRWKKLIGAARVSASFEDEEGEEDTANLPSIGSLLELTGQFTDQDQAVALQVLPEISSDEEVVKAVFLSDAVNEIRAETVESMLRDKALEMHGSERAVLTVEDQRLLLEDAGYLIEENTDPRTVMAVFDNYIDDLALAMTPSLEQKKEMLASLGAVSLDANGDYLDGDGVALTDDKASDIFAGIMADGEKRLNELLSGFVDQQEKMDTFKDALFSAGL